MRFLLLALFLVGCQPGAFDHNKGVMYLKIKDFEASGLSFVKALVKNPNLDVSRYGAAFSFIPQEKLKSAVKELDALIKEDAKAQDLFKAYFAKGIVYSMIGDLDKALDAYQKCLYLNPKSKEVKTNIELLFSGEGGGKGGKSKKSKKGKKDKSKKGDGEESDGESEEGEDQSNKDIQGGDKDSEQKKNLSPKELERILEELKQQEKKIRSKGYNGNKGPKNQKSKSSGGKPW